MFEFRNGSLHAESAPLEVIAMCMSSNDNSRPRAAEVMADGARTHLIRKRERPEALFALERRLR